MNLSYCKKGNFYSLKNGNIQIFENPPSHKLVATVTSNSVEEEEVII